MTQNELSLIKAALINADNLFTMYGTNLEKWQCVNAQALKIITREQLKAETR